MPTAVLIVGLAFAVVAYLVGTNALVTLAAARQAERDLQRELADKELAFKTQEAKAKRETPDSHAIPEDLLARIRGWDDEFAKADEERNIRVLYAELKDWDAVRRSLPPYTNVRIA